MNISMNNRQKRVKIAEETLNILEAGYYKNQIGDQIPISSLLSLSKLNSIHYKPEDFDRVFAQRDDIISTMDHKTIFEVKNETTLNAAKRLIVDEKEDHVLCLNFASAKNPGGGFLSGSYAQEESLARASGLYPCIAQMRKYYDANRQFSSSLYTDNMIYSPDVPVFRDETDELLHKPYTLSIITAPAVNRGAIEQNMRYLIPAINDVMLNRIEKLLSICVINQHKVIILGAWGCGVFRNKHQDIAILFRQHLLQNEIFKHAFKKVVFAVLDKTKDLNVVSSFKKMFKLSD
ncbi:MAG: TIGR02452 family protein [Desulfobacterales bacterium]|nr:TIGR02452 family protein [Desulfobacterales bacterium]